MFGGVVLAVSACLLFGLLSYYSTLLPPMDAYAIWSWRVLATVLVVALVISVQRGWSLFAGEMKELWRIPASLAAAVFGGLMMGFQLGLFGWAPLHGVSQQVAMGYFLMPLVMVLAGRVLYREKLSPVQGLAVACAASGVSAELLRSGGFSWVSLVIILGMPLYFIAKARLATTPLSILMFEQLVVLPPALFILVQQNWNPEYFSASGAQAWLMILGLGLISGGSLLFYIAASKKLPFALFGMLGYVEPLLIFLVSLVLGEAFTAADLWTYIPIWAAILLLIVDGWLHLKKPAAAVAVQDIN